MATINTPSEVIKSLMAGDIAVVPTDTLYGIVVRANDKSAVKKLYKVKARDLNKPCIVLITDIKQLKDFGVVINENQKEFLNKYWPGAVSVILPTNSKKYEYLHKGIGSIAFRMIGPRSRNLYGIMQQTGPLLAPSANPQGKDPATCIHGARRYFGADVTAYLCGGTRRSLPSTLVDYTKTKPALIRAGKVNIIF